MTAITTTSYDDWPARHSDASDRQSVLLIADAVAAVDGKAAILASGARLLGEVQWTQAVARLERQGLVRAILAETFGVADAALEPVLDQLREIASQGEVRIVIALEPDQIDLVTAMMGTAPVDLLCAATIGDRVGSLCVALSSIPARLNDVSAVTESVRFNRLTEEIARIAETLTRLTRGDEAPSRADTVSDPGRTYRSNGPGGRPPVGPEIRVRDVRDAIRARRLRDQMFGAGLFEDPAWDMLLDLFAAELERVQVSVSSLCIAAAVAPTTALRWIARMTEAGLFERRADPFDRRRAFIALSATASGGMRTYIYAVRQAGGGVA